MFATGTTELRGYGNPYCLQHLQAMSLQDIRRENFIAWMKASGLNQSRVATTSGVSYNTIRSYVGDGTGKQTASLTGVNEAKIARAFDLSVEDIFGSELEEPERNHLAAWRKFRFMTIDELADKIGVPPATIELLETTPRPPSDKWLRRLAVPLETTAGFILDFDPTDVDTAALEAALSVVRPAEAKVAERAEARRTGTTG